MTEWFVENWFLEGRANSNIDVFARLDVIITLVNRFGPEFQPSPIGPQTSWLMVIHFTWSRGAVRK
jgi:hypothetical protein